MLSGAFGKEVNLMAKIHDGDFCIESNIIIMIYIVLPPQNEMMRMMMIINNINNNIIADPYIKNLNQMNHKNIRGYITK